MLPDEVVAILRNYRTCELTTIAKNGAPITWPLAGPRLLEDGRFLLTSSIGMPQKLFNIRRNQKVSMLFSEPTGSGVTKPGAVLVQGNATAEDRIVSDPSAVPELAAYFAENIFARQPRGKFMSSWLGRRLMWEYYLRILIYVEPTRVRFWPSREFSAAPAEVEVPLVG